MNLGEFLNRFNLKSVTALVMRERIGKVDRGILKVAFMVAALDGEVTDAEYEAFDALAKKCRCYTPENAAAALDEAMRSAGYLMLLSKRVDDKTFERAFIVEARKALPEGFAEYELEDVRRAIVTWIAVGMCDGDYSERERVCIEALRREFAEAAIRRADEDNELAATLSPTFRMAYGQPGPSVSVGRDFVERVEKLAASFGDSNAAAEALQKLIDG